MFYILISSIAGLFVSEFVLASEPLVLVRVSCAGAYPGRHSAERTEPECTSLDQWDKVMYLINEQRQLAFEPSEESRVTVDEVTNLTSYK